jgi:hypothetical protein
MYIYIYLKKNSLTTKELELDVEKYQSPNRSNFKRGSLKLQLSITIIAPDHHPTNDTHTSPG